MKRFLAIPAAGGGFFFSSWLTMVFWGMLGPDLDLETISYPEAMVVTIGVWLVVTPVAGAVPRSRGCLWRVLAVPSGAGGFFLSSWFTMIFWGIVAPDVGVGTIGYVKAMLGTIGLWLVVGPLLGVISRRQGWGGWRL